MSSQDNAPTLSDVIERLDHNQTTLEEIATWLKISGVEKVMGLLKRILDKPEKILVYHYSTEDRSTRDIKDLSGASLFSISSYQTSWFRLGLMKTVPIRGKDRYVKNFNLEDYGIKIPETVRQDNQHTHATQKEDETIDSR